VTLEDIAPVISTAVENTPCGDAGGWTAGGDHDLGGVAKRASVSGERESNLLLFSPSDRIGVRTVRDVFAAAGLDKTSVRKP